MRAIYLLGTLLALAVALTSARYVEAEWDPSLMEARQQEEVADDDIDLEADDEDVPEAQNYEQLVVGPHRRGKWARRIRWGGHHKRSMDNERFELRSAAGVEEYSLIGTEAELKPYSTSQDLQKLGASKVIQVDLYQRRLAQKLPIHVMNSLGYEQSAVVITLEEGPRFLVVKGNQFGGGKAPSLIPANKMGSDWQKITSKAITSSVVSDFIAAAKPGYDVINNNGNQAAARMMQLP